MIFNYYKTTSSIYDIEVNYNVYAPGIIRSLGDWLDVKDKTVLDLGCGTGQLCWVLKVMGAKDIVGVNSCKEEIEIARERVDAKFQIEDILLYLNGLQDKSIDNIYALNILEHLEIDYLCSVLSQIYRVLKPKGTLTAIVPNATSPFAGMTRYWDITHVLSFTPSSVHQLKNHVGFMRAEFKELGPRPHGILSTIRFIIWRFIRIIIMFRLLVETASIKGGFYTADFIFRLTK